MENWQDITLGELANKAKIGVRRTRRFIKAHSPVALNVEINSSAIARLWELTRSAIAAPLLYFLQGTDEKLLPPGEETSVDITSEPVLKRKPHWRRAELVTRVLSESWALGARTYTQLMAAVKDITGKGCSKRAIANWKRDRGLL